MKLMGEMSAINSEVVNKRLTCLPKRYFKHVVAFENRYYYASLDSDDFSVIKLGRVSPLFKQPISKVKSRHGRGFEVNNAAMLSVEKRRFEAIMFKPSKLIGRLSRRQVRALKTFAEIFDKDDNIGRKYQGIRSRLRFTGFDNNKPTVIFEVVDFRDNTVLEKQDHFELAGLNLKHDKDFTVRCELVKHLPAKELELSYGQDGLVLFESTTTEEAWYFSNP